MPVSLTASPCHSQEVQYFLPWPALWGRYPQFCQSGQGTFRRQPLCWENSSPITARLPQNITLSPLRHSIHPHLPRHRSSRFPSRYFFRAPCTRSSLPRAPFPSLFCFVTSGTSRSPAPSWQGLPKASAGQLLPHHLRFHRRYV